MSDFKESKILIDSMAKTLIEISDFPEDQRWKLVYRATDDGYESEDFYKKTTSQKTCLTLIKSENTNVFGGYTDAEWIRGENAFTSDKNAFIFSLKNADKEPMRFECFDAENAVFTGHPDYVQCYGDDMSSISLAPNSNVEARSNAYLGNSYRHPNYPLNSDKANEFLAGSTFFKTLEIEVYCKIKNE